MKVVGWLVVPEVLVVGVLMICPPVGAQVRYLDENRVAHWVSSPDEVPERYRDKAETRRFPEITPTLKDTAVPVEQKISDVCESQFEFAKELTKKQWQEYRKRIPMRKYLPPECAEEISKAYPQTQLDE